LSLRVVAIGDCHFPWGDKSRLDAALAIIERFKPDAVVQVGDLFDLYSWSKYARSYDICTPKEELARARADAESMWAAVQSIAPAASCYQLLGNHDDRIFKMVAGKAPELRSVLDALDMHSLWRFPGVETLRDGRDELELDGVMYIHGYRKPGDHLKFFGKSVVLGHIHRGYCLFQRYHGKTLFELNSGFLAEQNSPVMNYTNTKTSDTTPGLGLIDGLGPRFIPL
jgi:metallophosphoesterase superfamily enzyme